MEEKRGKTGENGGKRGENGGKTGENGRGWGTVMNGSRSSGLLHCHYFLYAYPCLRCSHLHTDMSNFHPHEGILYVRIQHLVSQKKKGFVVGHLQGPHTSWRIIQNGPLQQKTTKTQKNGSSEVGPRQGKGQGNPGARLKDFPRADRRPVNI